MDTYVQPYPYAPETVGWYCAGCGELRGYAEDTWPGGPKGDCEHCQLTSGQWMRRVDSLAGRQA